MSDFERPYAPGYNDPILGELGYTVIESAGGFIYDVTPSDTIALTDDMVLKGPLVLSDTVSVTDTSATSLVYVVTPSADTIALTESLVIDYFSNAIDVLVNESIDIDDQLVVTKLPTVVLGDTISLTDGSSTSLVYGLFLQDSISVTDGSTGDAAQDVQASDTITLTDAVEVEGSYGTNDNIDVTDFLLAETYYDKSAQDAISVTDIATSEPNVGGNDTVAVTDAVSTSNVYGRVLSDTLVTTDKNSVQVDKTLGDTISVAEGPLEIDRVFPQDAINVTDSLTFEGQFLRVLSETLVITETNLADTQYDRSGGIDSLALTDSVTAVRERITNIDLGLDSVAVTDSSFREYTIGRDPNDNLQITDSVVRSVPFIRSVDETAIVIFDATIPSVTFTRILATDAIGFDADSSSATLERGVVLSDAVVLTETLKAETQYVRAVSDVLVLTDSITVVANKSLDVSVADTLDISSELVLAEVIDVDVEVADTLFITDSLVRESELVRTLSDSLSISETILAKLGGEVDRTANDTIALTDSASYILQPGALRDSITLSDLVTVERVTPLPVTMDADGLGLIVQLPQAVRYDRLVADSFHIQPLDRGVPVQVEQVLPVVSEVQHGLQGAAVNQNNPNFYSNLFTIGGAPSTGSSSVSGKNVSVEETVWINDSYRVDVLGPNNALRQDIFDGTNQNQYLEIQNGRSPGIYRIVGIPNTYSLILDRPLELVDPDNGRLQWRVTTAVTSVHFRTSSKITNQANYDFRANHLIAQMGADLSIHQDFYTSGIQGPRVVDATMGEDGTLVITYDQPMQADSDLVHPSEYQITGPTDVMVQKAWSINRNAVALEILGMAAGSYTLNVNASGTPHDVAGNPIDPLFNEAIFTGLSPLTPRSIFTDKGPIAKPGLTLQSGFGAVFSSITEVTLPGASLNSSHVGYYIKLGSMGLAPTSSSSVAGTNATITDTVSVSETLRVELSGSKTSVYTSTAGIYQIVGIVSATRVRLQASFNIKDPSTGTLYWELINPRNGEIADDPSDVMVKVNGEPKAALSVVGLLGQIVLAEAPQPTDDVKIDYSWVCNPTVEFRRLNSKEFRLNCWNNDSFVGPTPSQHRYRYNNTLIRPSDYEPLDMLAELDQPEERELHYRAYERAYTPVLNDPGTLLLNSPIHKIAFPSAQRTLIEQFITYEGTELPQDDDWELHGSGTASVSAGVLTVIDDTSGPFPAGQPFFWTHDLDLTFNHAFAMSWRFFVSDVAVPNGVFTGVATGYTDDKVAYVVGFLEEAGVKKIGFLKRGFGDDPSTLSSWTGALDDTQTSTNVPADFDWSILHSYRIFRDLNGVVRLYVDGDVVETLRITADECPHLEELNAPFDEIQGVFFGSLSREAENESKWDFVRYLILPTNPLQTAPSSFATYEADVVPELAAKPWTPIGFHGTETILDTNTLLLDSTSATDASTASVVGLMGGDFKGFVRMEPLLSMSSNVTVDVNLQLRTHTHGVDPYGLMFAVDDGSRLMQVAFFPHRSTPKLSYGGRSLPGDFSPFAWSSLGGATAAMMGRVLQITDDSTTDGLVYYIEDLQPLASDGRVVSSAIDYIQEFRCKVLSYTPDGSGFAGAFGQVFDGTRSVGVMLQDNAGTLHVALHADGVQVAQFAYDWDDDDFHTYRISKSTMGNLVTLFIDGEFIGSAAYSSFAASGGNAQISFGSSTPASNGALSVVDWAYCNAWRVRSDLRHYVGIWKGFDNDSLTGYHLPLKTSGRNAQVVGNALGDSEAKFITKNVVPGDQLIVDDGPNKGVYEVAAISSETSLTIVGTWPLNPTLANYRIARETDWTSAHKYRLLRGATGEVGLFYETDNDPLIVVGYNSIDLPTSGTGIVRTLTNGLPALAFGSFSSENLEQSNWDYVRYGITRSPSENRIAPHHQFLNQWNVMESPERLFTSLPHTLTSFKSSSTGIVPKKDPDFLETPALRAFTTLNEGTPLVPSTQSYQVRSPHPVTVYNGSLNNPEDTLNAPGGFVLNDASFQIRLSIPDDILYSALDVIEQTTGEEALIAPFGDCCGPELGGLQYTKETCLVYDADSGVLPQNDVGAPTPWALKSDTPSEVFTSISNGLLSYRSEGSRTVYKNNTTLPDAPGLQTEARFRFKVVSDQTLGMGDTKIRVGLSAPHLTVGLAFVTTPLIERYVLVVDLNNGNILGSISFDYLDGGTHEYVIVRDPGAGVVRVFINPGIDDVSLIDNLDVITDGADAEVIFSGIVASAQDTISTSDSVALAMSYGIVLNDSPAIIDIVTRNTDTVRTLGDTLALLDDVDVELDNNLILIDTVNTTDSTSTAQAYNRTLADADSLSDTLARNVEFFRTLGDTLALLDDVDVELDNSQTFTDAIGVTDSLLLAMSYNKTLSETADLTDDLTVEILTALGFGEEAFGFDPWGG